jgi:tetratricopeptide (TPR) repeat protein
MLHLLSKKKLFLLRFKTNRKMLEDITGEELKKQFKSNSKLRITTMIVGGLILLILGYFAYRQFVYAPSNEKSKDNYWIGLNYATADSTDMAIDVLNAHVKNYDGKIGGEVAQFVYARQLMSKGDFQKAIEELDGVDLSDTYVSIMAKGLKADCLSELKKYEEAANLYLEAADMDDNEFTTPTYLMKAGLCAEELNDFEMAKTCYERIKTDYAAFASQKTIDKYIVRAENQTTK